MYCLASLSMKQFASFWLNGFFVFLLTLTNWPSTSITDYLIIIISPNDFGKVI